MKPTTYINKGLQIIDKAISDGMCRIDFTSCENMLSINSANGFLIDFFVNTNFEGMVTAIELKNCQEFNRLNMLTNGSFDVVSGFFDFPEEPVSDEFFSSCNVIAYRQAWKNSHFYYALRAMQLAKNGGLIFLIISRKFMDAATPFVRMELVKNANVICAMRLPDNLIGSDYDFIVLQKNDNKTQLSPDDEYFIQSVVDRQTNIPCNKYFVIHPMFVLGDTASMIFQADGKPGMYYSFDRDLKDLYREVRTIFQRAYKENAILD